MARGIIVILFLAVIVLFAMGHTFVHHGHDDLIFHNGCLDCVLFLFAFAVATVVFLFAVFPSAGRGTVFFVTSPEYVLSNYRYLPYTQWYRSPLYCRPPPSVR